MPARRRASRLAVSLMLTLLSLLLVACGPSGGEAESDGDGLDEGRCNSTADCPPPLICTRTYCVEPGDGDSISCTSNFHCPPDMRCSASRGICVPINEPEPADGDEDGDLDDDEEDSPPVDGDLDEDGDMEDDEEEGEPPPDILVTFVRPLNGDVVSGSVTVEVTTVSDFTVERVEFFAFGGKIAERDSAPWQVTWDSLPYDEHPGMELRAVAYSGDSVGVGRVVVAVDHSPPTLTILAPQANQELGYYDDLEVVVEAGDNLAFLNIYVDTVLIGTLPIEQPQDTYGMSFDLARFAPGEHWLEVEVKDRVEGRPTTRTGHSFRVDTTPPVFDIEGVSWSDDDPTEGEVFAETPLVFRLDDVSGLATVNLTISGPAQTLLTVTDATRFPYTVTDFNSLLRWPNVNYPVTLTITASATDNFGNQMPPQSRTVTVKRHKWTYDPAQGNPDFSPPPGFVQRTGASAGDSGTIYASLYNELHAISPGGAYLWHCTSTEILTTTPVVVESPGQPTLILTATQGGRLWMAVDGPQGRICRSYEADINTESPAQPAVDTISYSNGGLAADVYHCVRKLTDTRCFKLSVAYSPPSGQLGAHLGATPVWNRTYTGVTPPSGIAQPRRTFTKPLVSAGNRIFLMDPANGNPNPLYDFNSGDNLRTVSAVPGMDLLIGCSDKTCRVFTLVLGNLEPPYIFVGEEANLFLRGQPISDESGMIYFNTMQIRADTPTGVVQAVETRVGGFTGFPWEFVTEGLPAGTPALGQGRMLYVAGENVNGNVWAVDLESETLGTQKRKAWQVQLFTEIFAPLLITPGGDLIVVGADAKLRAVDIRGDGPLPAADCWPQFQAQPSRQGYYWPSF